MSPNPLTTIAPIKVHNSEASQVDSFLEKKFNNLFIRFGFKPNNSHFQALTLARLEIENFIPNLPSRPHPGDSGGAEIRREPLHFSTGLAGVVADCRRW